MNWWQRYLAERRRRKAERAEQDRLYREHQVNQVLVDRWYQKNWWRFEPPEGWQVGYNIGAAYPLAMHKHLAEHGRIIRPSYEEVSKACGAPVGAVRHYFRPAATDP